MSRRDDVYHDNEHRAGDEPPSLRVPMLARDADGRIALTTEQALIVAGWTNGFDNEDAESDALWWEFFNLTKYATSDVLLLHPDNHIAALERWVLRWGPVVDAAVRQERSERAYERDCAADAPALAIRTRSQEHAVAVHATEAAVRAARDGAP